MLIIFRSKSFYGFVHDLRDEMRNLSIVHVKTHSQLLPFYLLVGHARIIGVEFKSLGLHALDKLLVVSSSLGNETVAGTMCVAL